MVSNINNLTRLRPYQEFLNRPTASAQWWASPNENVLGGRDLQRKEQGTWLGITKQGRIAVLTNFREDEPVQPDAKSRGAIVNSYLTVPADSDETTEHYIDRLVACERLKGVGGFSLVCGRAGEPLAVISNRTPSVEGTDWIVKERGETIGLSNTAFGDRSWPKVLKGEDHLSAAIKYSVALGKSKDDFVEALFQVLRNDNLPRKKGIGWETYVVELRKSIFIPAIGGNGVLESTAQDLATAKSGHKVAVEEMTTEGEGGGSVYGTQKHTVVLVDHQGRVTFVERSARDPLDRDRKFEFDIEGWKVK